MSKGCELMHCFNCVFAFSSTAQCRPCLHIPCLAITFKLTQPVYSPVTHPHTRVWYQVRSPSIPYTELTKTWWNSIDFIPSLIVIPKLSLFECKKTPMLSQFLVSFVEYAPRSYDPLSLSNYPRPSCNPAAGMQSHMTHNNHPSAASTGEQIYFSSY